MADTNPIARMKARHADELAAKDRELAEARRHNRAETVFIVLISIAVGALLGILASDEILPRGEDVGVGYVGR